MTMLNFQLIGSQQVFLSPIQIFQILSIEITTVSFACLHTPLPCLITVTVWISGVPPGYEISVVGATLNQEMIDLVQ